MPKRQTIRHSVEDAFLEVFESARTKGGRIRHFTLHASHPAELEFSSACFYFVEDARCRLRIAGLEMPVSLQPGDLAILPQGGRHQLVHDAEADMAPRVTAGDFKLEGQGGSLLTGALPRVLLVPSVGQSPLSPPDSPEDWLSVTLAAIRLESSRPSVGSGVMLSRLIDLMFVWALRHWLTTASPLEANWMRALDDPLIGHALVLLHSQPARAWRVDSLARQVNQSRSAFSQRFVDIMGEPPMRYLTRHRMQMAEALLASTRLPVSRIASRVGYDSEAAFSRAFRRHTGMAPVDRRKLGREAMGGDAKIRPSSS